jgi:glutamate-1-semialdehyde 2,1-aminomutase
VAAGMACLQALRAPGVYERLEFIGREVEAGLRAEAEEAKVAVTINRVGSMFTLFFTEGPVYDYPSAKRSDTARYARFFHLMLEEGVYLPPSQFESAFLSLSINEPEVAHILRAARRALRALGQGA